MPGLGPGGRRFESFHPDKIRRADRSPYFVGMKGFGKPHFISLRESAPFRSLAALRDRGLVRRLTRSNTFLPALLVFIIPIKVRLSKRQEIPLQQNLHWDIKQTIL